MDALVAATVPGSCMGPESSAYACLDRSDRTLDVSADDPDCAAVRGHRTRALSTLSAFGCDPATQNNMKRREWLTLLGVIAGPAVPILAGCASQSKAPAPAASTPATAAEPIETQDYLRLEKPVPVVLEPGKAVEVIEFFWYECPFCFAFEPLLVTWLSRQRSDVQFRPVPVGFAPRHVATQKFFYALEELGQRQRLHAKIFDAIHRQSRQLVSAEDQVAFVTEQGVDGTRFLQALHSPEVEARAQAATRLSDAYDVAGVPSMGIHGHFYTSASMASSRQRLLGVADVLIQRCREGC